MKKIHRYYSPFSVLKSIAGGSTLIRALFNETVKNYSLTGKVLDLGSKSKQSSYYRHINADDAIDITFTDLNACGDIVRVNVEEKFPFEDNSFDTVLAFHLFEHVFKYNVSAKEIYRVLKPGGKLILSVPFMHKYHADPDDYFRFTDSAIKKVWSDGGLECVSMDYVGEGMYTYFLTTMTRFKRFKFVSRPLQCVSYIIGTIIDRAINKLQIGRKGDKKTLAQLYALEHIAVFVK